MCKKKSPKASYITHAAFDFQVSLFFFFFFTTFTALLHTCCLRVGFTLVAHPLSWCPICKQGWIINYVVPPLSNTAGMYISAKKKKKQQLQSSNLCLIFWRVLESKFKFNVIAVARALKRPRSLNIHSTDSKFISLVAGYSLLFAL